MKKVIVLVAWAMMFLISSHAFGECTLTRESCSYDCIETNHQGQCVKTKKRCETVCVQFSVDVSGQDTKNYPPSELQKK